MKQIGVCLMQVTETEAGAAYRRVMIAVLCVGGGVIYGLPFLRQQFYLPLLQALRVNNTQLGVMSGVYGFAAMLSYFPGGWLADRISAKKLLTFSFIATGLGEIGRASCRERV
jgi:MFS family permease